jgi:hypothetical protein
MVAVPRELRIADGEVSAPSLSKQPGFFTTQFDIRESGIGAWKFMPLYLPFALWCFSLAWRSQALCLFMPQVLA